MGGAPGLHQAAPEEQQALKKESRSAHSSQVGNLIAFGIFLGESREDWEITL
jgi:hypothetical protein